ncbi:MAG: hypothetical protein KAU03_01005, partial [Candidatus Altiarchaeales archaeon]|nr:hypothetical protein [Candidatus Altiarchaeales archaeon]
MRDIGLRSASDHEIIKYAHSHNHIIL